MRTGRVSRKRYQVRRRGWGYAAVLAAGIIIGAAALALRQGIGTAHSPLTLLSVPAAPSRPPEETQPQERLLTLPGRAWFALSLGGYDTPEGARAQAEAEARAAEEAARAAEAMRAAEEAARAAEEAARAAEQQNQENAENNNGEINNGE